MNKLRTLSLGVYVSLFTPAFSLAQAAAGGNDAKSGGGIAGIASRVAGNLSAVADLIGQIAFVAGLLFFVSAVFKFKQHKDNPTQVPVGTPLTMLVISAALMFMGNFITPLGETLFAENKGPGLSGGAFSSGFGDGSS
ncbi:MAG: type IV secretion protein IcmD [Pseudomonadota bacterium]|nr:type IV secretion protein IcmD [Pseudomonadota bacterium]